MPRNGSGTYSLPAGNPVVTGNPVDSSDFNDTMTDLAAEMSDSLSRSGNGAMTAALPVAVGTVSLPGMTFSGDLDTGLYWVSANSFGATVGGVLKVTFNSDGLNMSSGAIRSLSGTVGAPGITWTSDPDCGLYRIGANNIGIAVAGALKIELDSSGAILRGDHTLADYGTGARILDGDGNVKPVGLHIRKPNALAGAGTVALANCGNLIYPTGADRTLNLANDADIPVGAFWHVGAGNVGTYKMTIAVPSGVTMYYQNGSSSGQAIGVTTYDIAIHRNGMLFKLSDTTFRLHL